MRHHASSSRALAHATWLLLAAANGCSSNTSDVNSGVNTPPASGTAGLGGLPTSATAGAGTVTAGKGAAGAPAANGGSGGTTTITTAGIGATAGTGGKAGAAGASTAGVGGTTGVAGAAAGSGGMTSTMAGAGGAHAGSGGTGGTAGAAAGSGGSSGSAATFTKVYAMFMTNCSGSSCHIGSAFGAGGLNMSTQAMAFTNLVGVASGSCSGEKRVVAGDPDKSELVHVLQQTQVGTCTRTPKMPEGKAKLAQTDIDLVVSWVMAGAANN